MGDGRTYVEIPGTKTHELPPLLVRSAVAGALLGGVLDHAAIIVDSEDILPATGEDPEVAEQRKFDLAVRLADQYRALVSHWQWGDSILEWIRQCEITFSSEAALRGLLHPDVWPHAGRSSFVTLLVEKSVGGTVALEEAVGLRLTFRQPPPIDCFSNQFLFYLNSTVAGTAYEAWARLGIGTAGLFPPDRFHFEVFDLGG
ncbi:MAG TPA: hypothetical protein VN442_14725 [Bryobacteraceae bacterium]|nr:hypothetical protein [Bryobacteraceae bacterium]